MEKPKHPIFYKAVGSVVFVLILSVFLFIRANKDKKDFNHVFGVVEYIENYSPLYPNKNSEKYRYLKIDAHHKPFELFVGKSAGDFKPKFENVDSLLPGDSVDAYYDENWKTIDDPVNRLVYFIDRGKQIIFIKGNWEQYLAFFLLAIGAIIFIWVWVLKKQGKIS